MNRKQVLKNMKNKKRENKISDNNENYFGRFIGIMTGCIIVLIASYLIVGIFINKTISFNKEEEEKEEATIDNTTILAGEIFNQKEEAYYVLIYDKSDKKILLGDWASLYSKNDDAITVYTVDSSKKLNAGFITEENSNTSPTSYEDLRIISPTLIKFENGVVTEYVEGLENIKNIFKGE